MAPKPIVLAAVCNSVVAASGLNKVKTVSLTKAVCNSRKTASCSSPPTEIFSFSGQFIERRGDQRKLWNEPSEKAR